MFWHRIPNSIASQCWGFGRITFQSYFQAPVHTSWDHEHCWLIFSLWSTCGLLYLYYVGFFPFNICRNILTWWLTYCYNMLFKQVHRLTIFFITSSFLGVSKPTQFKIICDLQSPNSFSLQINVCHLIGLISCVKAFLCWLLSCVWDPFLSAWENTRQCNQNKIPLHSVSQGKTPGEKVVDLLSVKNWFS